MESTEAGASTSQTADTSGPTGDEPEKKDTDEITEDQCFSQKSVSVVASSMGITNMTSEACQQVTEELYYKMKELIYVSRIVLHRNKRSILTTDDVLKALQMLGNCQLFGHRSKEKLNYVYIPKADIYCEDDSEVELPELALTDDQYLQKGDPYVQGAWIMTEDYSEESLLSKPSSYYLQIAKTIMTGSPAHLKVALSDLRTNPKIGPICPYFLNLVALTIKKVPRDTHLTNALIGTVHAIAHNKYVDPSPYLAVNRAANSLLKIVIEIDVVKDYGDLAIRIRAGLLLAKIVTTWSIELKQQIDIVKHLLQHLLDPTLPLQSHYGAIVALTALGQRTLDFYLWPVMERYLALLEHKAGNAPDLMVQHVMAAILVAARSTYRKEHISAEQLRKLSKVDLMMYTSFGDTVTPFRMVCSGPPIYPCVKREPNQSSLRLRVSRSLPLTPRPPPVNVGDVFELTSFQADPSKLPNALYYDPNLVKKRQSFAYVTRNYKFCCKLYKNSPAGDLLTLL